jgi:hypothetical protein
MLSSHSPYVSVGRSTPIPLVIPHKGGERNIDEASLLLYEME